MDHLELEQERLSSVHANLQWTNLDSDLIINSHSDLYRLRNLRNIVLKLHQQFQVDSPQIQFSPDKRDDLSKRLILLESEIDGMMKRRINCSTKGHEGQQRVLDYANLLNQKENQIVELEKKIQNYEQRLRRLSAREQELQNHIVHLNEEMKSKQAIIIAKNNVILAEVASTNLMKDVLNKIKKNIDFNRSRMNELERVVLDGVVLPDVGSFEIKSDTLTKDKAIGRSRIYESQSQSQKLKTRVVQMFREFERLTNQPQGITEKQVQKILQGFLIEFNNTRLYEKVQLSMERNKLEEDYVRLRDNFAIASGIYQANLLQLKKDNPSILINLDNRIFDILRAEKVQSYIAENGVVFVDAFVSKTVEVPVQDARTKHLLHLLAVQMKKLVNKYPKLKLQLDERLSEFFQQELIDLIEVDEIDKLVGIVKYVPQVVKVENVYAYANEKTRKVEFHLRVLVKALMEELQKIKNKTGVVLEIDEGVIGMINKQIMDVVNVDDVLKVFRVVPKIVEVEKIVEKIVERMVEVPQVITIEKIVQKIVEVEKIRQVEKIVNVPIEKTIIVDHQIEKIVPIQNIFERVIEVPTVVDRIIQVIRQVPKIVEVPRIEERIVEVDKVIEVERVVNHIQVEVRQVEVIKQVIVSVERIIQKIVEVPVIVERIVERIVEVPKIIEVEKIVEKIVPLIEYRNARQVQNHIEVQHQIVERIVEKPIPIVQVVERIKQVPLEVEKIVTVTNTVTKLVEVQVIRQKIIIQEKIREVEKINTHIVEVIKEVPKQIQKFIQIPVFHQKIVKVQQFIQKLVIQKSQTTFIKEIYLRDPLIVYENKIMEVEKIINHYIQVPKMVKYYEEKIVEVPRHIDRIKQVRVIVQKVIQKMVEVPKVVEVEKIVEKIVIVPRIIQKVIQVPQIIQKIVEKEVIKQVIREVEKIVQVPVIQQRIVEVDKERIVYFPVQTVVDRIVEKFVQVPKYEEKIITKEIIKEKVIEVLREVPKQLYIDKIVPHALETIQIVQVEKNIIIPFEVPVPVDRIVEKLVPCQQIRQRIVQVPQQIRIPVPVVQEVIKVQQVDRVIQKVVVDHHIQQVQKLVPYYSQVIRQVPTIVQKIVPIQTTVQQIITAHQIIQKVVDRAITVPRIYQVEKIQEVLVQVPKFIQMQKIVPQLVRVNHYIQRIVEKIVQVPIIMQQIKQIINQKQKIVPYLNQRTQILQVEKNVQKLVINEKIIQVIKSINHIQKVLQIVDRYEQIPVPILSQHEKFIEVPYILQKIVERIVVMPQIVQVLKYVHEVCQSNDLGGVAVGVDVATHQDKYKSLSKDLKVQLQNLLREIRVMKIGSTQQNKNRIQTIQKFLAELQKFILFPKIVKVVEQKIVQKPVEVQKIIKIPVQDERSLRMQLSLTILVEKLISEIKRIQSQHKINIQLDQDIQLIFLSEIGYRNDQQGQMAIKMERFSNQIQRKFQSLGPWSVDHQLMLNSFLQQRFAMAELVQNSNIQIEKSKQISQKRLEVLRKYKNDKIVFEQFLNRIKNCLSNSKNDLRADIGDIYRAIDQFGNYLQGEIRQPTRILQNIQINNNRIESILREKDQQIYRLKDLVYNIERQNIVKQTNNVDNSTIKSLRSHNQKLILQINELNDKLKNQGLIEAYKEQIKKLSQSNQQLQNKIFQLRQDILSLQHQLKQKQANRSSYSRANEAVQTTQPFLTTSRFEQSLLQSDRRGEQTLPQRGLSESGQKKQGNNLQPSNIYDLRPRLPTSQLLSSPVQTNLSTSQFQNQGQSIKEGQSTFNRSPYQYSSPQSTGRFVQSELRNISQQRGNTAEYETPSSQRGQTNFGGPNIPQGFNQSPYHSTTNQFIGPNQGSFQTQNLEYSRQTGQLNPSSIRRPQYPKKQEEKK